MVEFKWFPFESIKTELQKTGLYKILYTAGIAENHACGEETPTVEFSVLQQVTLLKQEAFHFNGE